LKQESSVKNGDTMTQLVKGITNGELWLKADYEGIEYLFLNYFSLEDIIDEDLAKATLQFRLACAEIQSILEEYEPDEDC
jgi:hypothetical protein